MKKKVIIVGAGVGGLATALRLLSNGYEVEIYEKEETIGGTVNFIQTEGFRFDLSASILMMPNSYKEIFSYVNKNYADYLEFIEIDPIYRLFSSDGTAIDFNTDMSSLTKTLEGISKEDSLGYFKFISDVYEKYLIANKYFLQKSQDTPKDSFNLKSIQEAFKVHTLSNAYEYISKYIKDEKLRNFLAFQCMYIGISPFNGPNIYTLIPVVSQLYGLWYIKGGMYSFINALSKLIYEFGGIIKTGVTVEEILFLKDKAIGVKTSQKTEKADLVVCNADFSYAMKNLVKDEYYKDKYNDKKLSEMKYSCSTFIIHLGLRKEYPKLAVHNIYLGKNFKENIESAFKGMLPNNPSLYIYCPSRIDKSMAKMKGDCLNIMLRVPNLFFKEVKWDKQTSKLLTNIILNELKNIKGLEDIEENIQYEDCFTPLDMESKFNTYGGTSFGLSPTLKQMNYFRPHFKSSKVNNLFFVGSSLHPGPGISLVLNSSTLVTEEILKMDIYE
ncbi:phytoene desaturase family protein [Clostridium psychrophilum]|uniref:phytoene desaturase family protein n=1 Tax=Clostridium psychrophilum TaxID=132926 RepID=UPI001C0CD421|nr:phytoene desaturase family protein [Clostridium psychrophilum]MBU3180828.1 phytoene desaturase [Clostridium psychrophilum]